MVTEQEVELQKHLERRLVSLLDEFEHWYGRPVTMATLCNVAASARLYGELDRDVRRRQCDVKWQLAIYPLGEVAFGRTLFAFLTVAPIALPRAGWGVLRTRRYREHLQRGLPLISMVSMLDPSLRDRKFESISLPRVADATTKWPP